MGLVSHAWYGIRIELQESILHTEISKIALNFVCVNIRYIELPCPLPPAPYPLPPKQMSPAYLKITCIRIQLVQRWWKKQDNCYKALCSWTMPSLWSSHLWLCKHIWLISISDKSAMLRRFLTLEVWWLHELATYIHNYEKYTHTST